MIIVTIRLFRNLFSLIIFQAQRYEAASTLYGPHTLNLHLMQYKNLAAALKEVRAIFRPTDLILFLNFICFFFFLTSGQEVK